MCTSIFKDLQLKNDNIIHNLVQEFFLEFQHLIHWMMCDAGKSQHLLDKTDIWLIS